MTMRHAAGGAGPIEEPEKTSEDPIWTDEPTDRPDDAPDGGTPAAIAGTSLAGPTGGTVGALADEPRDPTVDDADDPEQQARG